MYLTRTETFKRGSAGIKREGPDRTTPAISRCGAGSALSGIADIFNGELYAKMAPALWSSDAYTQAVLSAWAWREGYLSRYERSFGENLFRSVLGKSINLAPYEQVINAYINALVSNDSLEEYNYQVFLPGGERIDKYPATAAGQEKLIETITRKSGHRQNFVRQVLFAVWTNSGYGPGDSKKINSLQILKPRSYEANEVKETTEENPAFRDKNPLEQTFGAVGDLMKGIGGAVETAGDILTYLPYILLAAGIGAAGFYGTKIYFLYKAGTLRTRAKKRLTA